LGFTSYSRKISSMSAGEPRSKQIVIALTGGPSSGKSSILAIIRDRLSKRGSQVLSVPEYATHFFANSDGFQGSWVGTEKEEEMQHIFCRYQIMQEDMFRSFASLNDKNAVILVDRGVMDQKVFASSEKMFESALARNKLTEEQVLSRYDLVIHLGTTALVGEYQWGPGSNNPGRYHSPEEAAKCGKDCEQVYSRHKQLRLVPHFKKFEDKVETTMKYLEDALGVDGLSGKRQRVVVSMTDLPEEVHRSAQAFLISSLYLDQAMQLSVRRRARISVEEWRHGLAAGKCPLFHPDLTDTTFEERRAIPDDEYLARRVITEHDYETARRSERSGPVDKCVLCFQCDGSHFELLYFQDIKLVLDFAVGAVFPTWLTPRDETTPVSHPSAATSLSGQKRELLRHSTSEAAAWQSDGFRVKGARLGS